jgi:aspartyl-tRNA(Asn)/glutamyl-tRNA(Gln) amidotransferase subunit B
VNWEPVIGLEIHVQLKTRTKMFCRCANGFGGGPNTQTCPVCLAFPGALPVANKRAVEECIKLGLALECEIADRAVFHRKNYFYPDLPKAYQISQYDEPLCANGKLAVPTADGEVMIGITRAHLEEDAAKNVHVAASGRLHGATATLVDFNRGGTPLVEIVTEPDLHDADTAKRFLQLLRQTVVELDLSDAELEKGSMRFDVNVSVRPAGSDELRTRTELKNMNSFNFAAKGIEREIARQIRIYEEGGTVDQETLHFDPTQEDSPPSRSKEEAQDYRYFPDPDLVPVHPPAELVERLKSEIGELPGARIKRIADTLSFYDADVLVTGGLDRLWSDVVAAGADAKEAANVLSNQFVASGGRPEDVDPAAFAKLIDARRSIPRATFDEAIVTGIASISAVEDFLQETTVSDTSELDPIIDKIIEANPGQAEQFRSGKDGLLGFFVGQVMKETGGKADPARRERPRARKARRMSLVELAPRHLGWQTNDGVSASLKLERAGDDVAIASIQYDDPASARELVNAVADVMTAPRIVGGDDVLEHCGFERDGGRWVRELTVEAAPDELTWAVTLTQLETAIRTAWSAETSDRPDSWTPVNPAYQQCDVTARVVRDYLGGEILVAGVVLDGLRVDRHAWNRLPSGLVLDLTREQFRDGERLEEPVVNDVVRIDRNPERYELLASRVRATLGLVSDTSSTLVPGRGTERCLTPFGVTARLRS